MLDLIALFKGFSAVIRGANTVKKLMLHLMELIRDPLIFEPDREARLLYPQYLNSHEVGLNIDVRNPTERAFYVDEIVIKQPEGITVRRPDIEAGSVNGTLQVGLHCQPGITQLPVVFNGEALRDAKQITFVVVFSRASGGLLRWRHKIVVPVRRRAGK